jgi:hypothetical protein
MQLQLDDLAVQVKVLRAESAVRRVLGRYMFLCDSPLPASDMSDEQRCKAIADLFVEDGVWEGVGAAHGAQFGKKVGPEAIAAHMLTIYSARNPRQIFNTHYLCTESLTASAEQAEGHWVQFQPWIYDDGTSILRSSRLHVRFRDTTDGWRIAHYRTENLFIAELPHAWTSNLIAKSVLLQQEPR